MHPSPSCKAHKNCPPSGIRLNQVAVALALAFPAAVFAQEAASGVVSLDEVNITTTKSSTSIEDSPRAISVVSKQELATASTSGGVQSVLADNVPGISYAQWRPGRAVGDSRF